MLLLSRATQEIDNQDTLEIGVLTFQLIAITDITVAAQRRIFTELSQQRAILDINTIGYP
jgi:hypothetical protein